MTPLKKNIFIVYVFQFLCLLGMSSCGDDTFIFLYPEAPVFYRKEGDKEIIFTQDSIKIGLKNDRTNNERTFYFRAQDTKGENIVTGLRYTTSNKDSELYFRDAIFPPDITFTGIKQGEELSIVFKPQDRQATYQFEFQTANRFQDVFSRNKTKITFVIFANRPPEANFEIKDGLGSQYALLLDASRSFDRDKRFGGGITTFEYTILRNSVPLDIVRSYDITTMSTPIVVPGAGSYEITLRVYDNDGVSSNPITKTRVINP